MTDTICIYIIDYHGMELDELLSKSINLISYRDYREFLKDFHSEQKKAMPSFTLEKFAIQLQLSLSMLKMILSGKRDLTISHIHQFAVTMKLDQEEHYFFEALVLWNQSSTKVEKNYYKNRLDQFESSLKRVKKHTMDQRLMHKWYFSAVILYIIDVIKPSNFDFDQDIFLILKKKFNINWDDFCELKKIFQNSDLASINSDGKVSLNLNLIGRQISKNNYYKQLISASLELLNTSDKHSCAMSITKSELQKFKDDYKKLIDKYVEKDLSLDSNETQIIQTIFQIIPF